MCPPAGPEGDQAKGATRSPSQSRLSTVTTRPKTDTSAGSNSMGPRPGLAGTSTTRSPCRVNVEDFRIDHDPGRPVGVAEITVAADRAGHLLAALEDRGWTAHG